MKKQRLFLLLSVTILLLAGCGGKENRVTEEQSVETETQTVSEDMENDSEESEPEAVTEEPEKSAAAEDNKAKDSSLEEQTSAETEKEQDSQKQSNTQNEPSKPQTTEPDTKPEPEPQEPQQPESVSYSPQRVVQLATEKTKAAGKLYIPDDLDWMLAEGTITQEDYNDCYPTDGAGYLEFYVATDLKEARDVSGTVKFNSEDDIAANIAGMYGSLPQQYFYIEYHGTVMYGDKECYLVAENLVTGSDGKVLLSNLHLGTYVVTETASIDGYTINTTPQTVNIEYKDQNVEVQYEATSIYNNRQKASVSVTKKDADTENPLDGGKYTLYAGNDIRNYDGSIIVTKGTALQTVTTGEDGNATYTVDLPIANSYYVSETQAPYGYIRNAEDVYSFNFNYLSETKERASFSHTFVNDHTTAKIHLYKVDKETEKAVPQGDASLTGAVYGVYAREDIVHPDGATGVLFKAGDLVATITTNKNAEAEIKNLYLGKYYLKEIQAPEGYLLDEAEHDVICDYEGDLVPEVARSTKSEEQVYKRPFQLIKVSDNGDDTEAPTLAGAGFTAYLKSSLTVKEDGSYDYESAEPVIIGSNGETTLFTDSKGHLVTQPIPYGTYVVLETVVPHNVKEIKPFEVHITENHPTEPQVWRVFIDREFTAKLRIVKKDSKTGQTVLVPNAEFKIYNLDTKEYVVQYTTYPTKVKHTSFFTDDDGDLILPETLKLGNYRIEEVAAPDGYVVNEEYITFAVDTDTAYETDPDTYEAIITADYVDQPAVGELTVEKKGEVLDSYKGGLFAGSEDKEFVYREGSLAGAEFAVYAAEDIYTNDYQKDENGERTKYYSEGDLVATLVTDENRKAVLSDIPLGTYKVVETKAPYGYVLNKEERL